MKAIVAYALAVLFLATATLNSMADLPPIEAEEPEVEIKAAASSAKPAPAAGGESPSQPVALVPGTATVIGQRVNVRAQATVRSEVVTQVNEGDEVTVLDYIIRTDTRKGDPALWAQIRFPEGAPAYVHASFIDPADDTVKPRRLNVRAGPGENYSIVGRLERGAKIREIVTEGNWIKIEPPQSSSAYVAAKYLRQDPALVELAMAETVVEAPAEPEPVEVETPLAEPAEGDVDEVAIAQESAEEGSGSTTAGLEEPGILLPIEMASSEILVEQPPPPRVVQREGIVRGFTSIQAPSSHKLVAVDGGRRINYLHSMSTNLNLRRYENLRIIVEGEESLDKRWPDTPVLTIRKIYVVE